MIPIKEHNDIVQQLMKELTVKENELKLALKDKSKTPVQSHLEPTPSQKVLNSKISQLNKEYKEKMGNLAQQLRSKSIQNKQLRERLTAKTNMQVKQKDHIAEILKKNYDRKPSSAADYKISALIKHYEDQLGSKQGLIDRLQNQIKSLQSKQASIQVNQNYKEGLQNEIKPKGVSLVQHQRQVGHAKLQINKFKKLYQEKEKEYKDLSKRYSDLTKQYYKIINAYGLTQANLGQPNPKPQQYKTTKKELHSKLKTSALRNLLQEMVVSDSECDQNSYLEHQPREIEVKPKCFRQESSSRQDLASSKLQQALSIIQINDPTQLVPRLLKWKTQIQEYQLADTICRSLQAFFYNIGKGKISKKDLVHALQELEQAMYKNLEAVDLLDELCIEVGAKRQKLREKVGEVLKIKEEYFMQLKNLKYTQQLGRANKVIQFIEFFGLDKEDAHLPQQLTQLQEQLKSINKYAKEVRAILDIESQKPVQMVLELALRYMQKSSSILSQYERKGKNT